jgi:predicted PurR-regulated permease PerM
MITGQSATARPAGETGLRVMAVISVAALSFAALHAASSVFVPATFALFIIAVVWPLHSLL